MKHRKQKNWLPHAPEQLLGLCNLLFVLAFLVNWICPWFMFVPLVVWISSLVILIRRDLLARNVSAATITYLILSVLLAGFTLYALVYSILH